MNPTDAYKRSFLSEAPPPFDPYLADCGSNSCYFKSNKDRQQRTNSGCKCLSHLPIDEQIAIRKKFKLEKLTQNS